MQSSSPISTWYKRLFPLGLGAGALAGLALWRYRYTARPASGFCMADDQARTALITGASSGIGAAFAQRLAAEQYRLILVARRAERLTALAQTLQQRYAVPVQTLVANLANPADVTRIAQEVRDHHQVSLLINNAGFGTTGHFAEVDLTPQLAMIHVHINASVHLSRAALPGMLARHHGAIINVSSIAAFLPAAHNVTYSSSKAYLNVFSRALQQELQGTGIQVQALCPGFTYTEFHDTPEYAAFDRANVPAMLWMSAEEVVTRSLAGLEHGQVICIPGMRNRLLVAATNTPLLTRLLRRIRSLIIHRR